MSINFVPSQDIFSSQNGQDCLAGLRPLGIPFPKFTQEELITEQARFRMALEYKSPFYISLENAKLQPGQIPFPLKSLPLYIPEIRYPFELAKILGEHEYINPFLEKLIERRDKIPLRRFPKDIPLSSLDGHYLPVSVAGAMLSRKHLRDGNIDASQHYSPRFNSILGLFHDGPEDDIFSLAEIEDIKSKEVNGQLATAVRTFTRNGTHNNPNIQEKNGIYRTYGEQLGEVPNLALMKWIDISITCLGDMLNGVQRPTIDRYVEKQSIVLQAMGNILLERAGNLLSIDQSIEA